MTRRLQKKLSNARVVRAFNQLGYVLGLGGNIGTKLVRR